MGFAGYGESLFFSCIFHRLLCRQIPTIQKTTAFRHDIRQYLFTIFRYIVACCINKYHTFTSCIFCCNTILTIQICIFQSTYTCVRLTGSIHFGLMLEYTLYHIAYNRSVWLTGLNQILRCCMCIRQGKRTIVNYLITSIYLFFSKLI